MMLAFLFAISIFLLQPQIEAQNIEIDSAHTPLPDSVAITAIETEPLVYERSPTIAYLIEKHISRAYRATQKTLASLHIEGRFPIHIIIFVICLSLVVLSSVDATRKKPNE